MSSLWILDNKFSITDEPPRKGGFASVYKAIDLKTGQKVAIKLFDNSSIKRELSTEAFQRDLKSLTELNSHKHIANLISFGRDPETGNDFIALEWLEEKLLDVINRNEITCWEDYYLHYGRPILEALSFSHKRDIVHRDIKPANVLFSENGELRLTDFGISKYKSYLSSNVTFFGWNSKPYSPPENDNLHFVNARDVYGFAALSLACLERRDLKEDENVIDLIKNHALEESISEILEQCLSYSAEERIQSVEELIDSLDRFSSRNKESASSKEKCYLALTTSALQKLQLSIGAQDKTSIERHIKRELNEACSIRRKTPDAYTFISVEHSYTVAIDKRTKSHFVILSVARKESWILENEREKNYTPEISYHVGTPSYSEAVRNSTLNILEDLSDYEENALERQKEAEENDLINRWRSQLRLTLDLERIARKEIPYSKFEISNGRVSFTVENGDWLDTIGEQRLIKANGKKLTPIIINSVSEDKIYASSNDIDEEEIPIKGCLILDTRRQAVSRIRQEAALDSVIFEGAHRANLKKLIFSPQNCTPHSPVIIDSYFQDNLDEAKKNVVSAALGLNDFLVVKGPPGTGKTKVIAETALQFLKQKPDAKILISSQTHNALDNALERIKEVNGAQQQLNAVRVGRKDDSRISLSMRDFLLENLVSNWLKGVKERSSEYLTSWSEKIGVNKNEVELGLAVRTLRQAINELENFINEREELHKEIKALEKQIAELKSSENITEDLSVKEFNLDSSTEKLIDLDNSIVRARRNYRNTQKQLIDKFSDGESLANMHAEELLEWESEYLSGSKERQQCREIIELLQDWYDRFGRSSDFNAAFLNDSSIVAATCIGIGLKDYKDVKFDLCIIDEASKATPTETLLPIVKSKKWILVGDQAQLPPFVQEGAQNPQLLSKHKLNEGDLKRTLLDTLIEKLPKENIIPLDTQYRMRPEIGDLVSKLFYDGTLKTGREAGTPFEELLAIKKPVTWYSTSSSRKKNEKPKGNSYINRLESDYIANLITRFNLAAKSLGKRYTLCALSFYSSQKEVLQSEIARISSSCSNLDIICDTVDAFQGREADICIISITRSNDRFSLGFVNDKNRINVAISRGKEALAIVGDADFCQRCGHDTPISQLINHIQEDKARYALEEI